MAETREPDLHLVLVEPEIPWNTGNAGRSCLAFGARLHLVRPLGFDLSEKGVRRAGLDYWDRVPIQVHDDWAACESSLGADIDLWLLSPEAPRRLDEVPAAGPAAFVLGRESEGLPLQLLQRYADRRVAIPQARDSVRSLNQSTAAAIALYHFRSRSGRPPGSS